MFLLSLAVNGMCDAIYVSPDGSLDADGSLDRPFSLEKALAFVRAEAPDLSADLHVKLRGGEYRLTSPIRLGPQDSNSFFQIKFEAYGEETPVLSGSAPIENWVMDGSVATAILGEDTFGTNFATRQLYVDGIRATRARSIQYYDSHEADPQSPIYPIGMRLSEDRLGYDISDAKALNDTASEVSIGSEWKNHGAVELVYGSLWTESRCLVESIENSKIVMRGPAFSPLAFFHQDVGVGNEMRLHEFRIENALELLDAPGEWYYDAPERKMHFMPEMGIDVDALDIRVPVLEQLIVLENASNVEFHGLRLVGTGWVFDPDVGFVEIQANIYRASEKSLSLKPDIDVAVPSSAVEVIDSRGIRFSECVFRNLGGIGLSSRRGVNGLFIEGCLFEDIASNGIMVGGFQDLGSGIDEHDPPKSLQQRNIQITNNYITKVGADYKGAVGIFAGYARDCIISNNSVVDVPYTGISTGYAWGHYPSNYNIGNQVVKNEVRGAMRERSDGGAIYNLGPQGYWNNYMEIEENYVHDIYNGRNLIYVDGGSKYIDVRNNLIDNDEFEIIENGSGLREIRKVDYEKWRGSEWLDRLGGNAFFPVGGCNPFGFIRFRHNFIEDDLVDRVRASDPIEHFLNSCSSPSVVAISDNVNLSIIDNLPDELGSIQNEYIVPKSYQSIVDNAGIRSSAYEKIRAVVERERPYGPRMFNLSARSFIGEGKNSATVGFVVEGSPDTRKNVLLRLMGQELNSLGFIGASSNPSMRVFKDGALLASNDDWEYPEGHRSLIESASDSISIGWPLEGDSESAALVLSIGPGYYTVKLSAPQFHEGDSIFELYDLSGYQKSPRLVNFSANALIKDGKRLVGGFAIGGLERANMLIRATGQKTFGPRFGAVGYIEDPSIYVANWSGDEIERSLDWDEDSRHVETVKAGQAIGAFSLVSRRVESDAADAALFESFAPGVYSVSAKSEKSESGRCLLEVYLEQ